MKNLTKLFTALIAVFAILAFVDGANAQRRYRGNNYSKAQVSRLIKNVEERVDRFVGQYDKSLDHSRLNGTNREDVLNQRAKDLESATDELRREFDKRDSWAENKNEVSNCLNIAADINANMKKRRYGRGAETNWRNVVRELNALAVAYNLPAIGSGVYR